MAWKRGPTIGRGSSAAVSLATTSTGDIFAVKSTDLASSTSLQKEEHLISQLSSPYIVNCLGSDTTCEKNKPLYNLFLEYLPGGTLSDHIKQQGNSLDENAIRIHAYHILLGLNYLHQKGLVHCDIKGQNILLTNDGLKIADFGCAKWINSGGIDTQEFAGTPAYMAPEVARGEEQSFPADIWALGCTVIEMATGANPWPDMKDPASALYRIAYSGEVPATPGWFSGDGKDFIGKCLMRDPRERWTAAELLRHPFFSSVEENYCGLIGEFRWNSPTSVMDQGIWDDLDVSDSSPQLSEIASCSDSPAGRIRDLIGDGLIFGDWAEEEGWLTVRGDDEIEECFEDLIGAEETVSILSVDEEEGVQNSTLVEDSLFDCFNGDSNSAFPVTNTECVKDFSVFTIIICEIIMLMELFFLQDHLFFEVFSLFFCCQ